MKKSSNSTITEVLFAFVLVCVVSIIFSIGLSSCATSEVAPSPVVEKKEEAPKKDENTLLLEEIRDILKKRK